MAYQYPYSCQLFCFVASRMICKCGHYLPTRVSPVTYDFVLITNCNHTVVSRGTYSMWMGLLSPGEIYTEYGAVIPDHMQE